MAIALGADAQGGSSAKGEYAIMYGDNQIGVLIAKKANNNNTITYQLLTELTASLIKEFHITYDLSVTYKSGYMTKAFTRTAVNQHTWDSTHIRWHKNQYQVEKQGENTYDLDQKRCRLSTARLYFQRPTPKAKIFSEQYCKLVPVEKIKPDVYKLTLPSGNANLYHYDKKGLKKVVVNDTPVQVRFVRL